MKRKKKQKYSRLFIYQVYKAMCRMLDAIAICNGKIAKKDKLETIYAEKIDGRKFPLSACFPEVPAGRVMNLVIGKKKKKIEDMQKEIVKRILKTLKTRDVFIADSWHPSRYSRIKQWTCFEQMIIEDELQR